MEKVIKYRCNFCGDLFDSRMKCLEHEDRHGKIRLANEMFKEGHSLKEIQDKCNIWSSVPEYLEDVTKDNCFVVEFWQCCDKPAYHISYICFDGKVVLGGFGSDTGYFGHEVDLSFRYLQKPRPKEELFVSSKWRWQVV